jgi:hypothetical protein
VGNVGQSDFGWSVPNKIKYAENISFIALENGGILCRNI